MKDERGKETNKQTNNKISNILKYPMWENRKEIKEGRKDE
jgi:hypothetical protein